jgi:hypothetical protein
MSDEPNLYKENYDLRKQVDSLQAKLDTREHHVFLLAEAITEAAHDAGIIADPKADLSGPQLMLVIADMAECIKSQRTATKVKIWTAITDGGDGEHHSHTYKSKQEMIDDLELTDVNDYGNGDGYGMDNYGYMVQFEWTIFDTDGYEVIE